MLRFSPVKTTFSYRLLLNDLEVLAAQPWTVVKSIRAWCWLCSINGDYWDKALMSFSQLKLSSSTSAASVSASRHSFTATPWLQTQWPIIQLPWRLLWASSFSSLWPVTVSFKKKITFRDYSYLIPDKPTYMQTRQYSVNLYPTFIFKIWSNLI